MKRWQGDVETRHGTSLPGSPVKFVIFPSRHIVFDVIRDFVHVFVATNDVVVETGLPREGEVVLVGEFRN